MSIDCWLTCGCCDSMLETENQPMSPVQHEQLRLHSANVLPMCVGAGAIGLILVLLLQPAIATAMLLAWLACVAGMITARVLVRRWQLAGTPGAAIWLGRYRWLNTGTGVVWGLAGLMLFPSDSVQQQTLLVFVLAGVAASNVMLHAFDLRAALLFVVPTLLPLGLRLVGQGNNINVSMGLMVLAFLGVIVFMARRAHGQMLDLVMLRDAERQRADEARRNAELLQTVFGSVGEGIAVFDAELRLAASNDRFRSLVRMDPARMTPGTPLSDLLEAEAGVTPSDDAGPGFDVQRQLADFRRNERLVQQYRRHDGQLLEMRRSPVPGGGCVVLLVDLTERTRTEAALADKQRMLSLLMDTSQQGFWFVDNALRTTDLNDAMCRMLGRSREQILGQHLFSFVDADNAAIVSAQVKLRDAGQAGGYEMALLQPDGSLRHCHNNATPVFDAQGHKVGAVGLFTDISARKRAQQRLEHTSALLAQKSSVLQMTLDSVSQGFLSLDPSGRCNAYNQRLIELLELPPSLFEPMPTLRQILECQLRLGHFGADLELLDAEHRLNLHAVIAGRRKGLAANYVRRTTSGRTLEVRSHPLPDGCVVRTFTDVSEHHQTLAALRASEAHASKLALVAAHTDSAVSICDARGRVEWVNRGFERLTGYSLAEVQGRKLRHLVRGPDTNAAAAAAIDERLARGERCSGENVNYGKDGRRYWVGFDIDPVRDSDGRITHYITNDRDISERRAAEMALVAARDEAERANRAKSQFLSRVSHELRTPMNAILGFGQLLQSSPELPPSLRGYVRELMHGGSHLLNLINEVLDLARIEAGQFQLSDESVDLHALAAECLAMLTALAHEQQIGLQLQPPNDAPVFARADRMRLKQVLLNLLSNAIKYNRRGGSVSLHCVVEGGLARLHVRDTGPGLQPQQLRQLFKAFERLDAHKSAIEGTGIGLALSRRLMQVMHGEIGVNSEPGVGSDFWVQLPHAPSPPPVAAAGSAPRRLPAAEPPRAEAADAARTRTVLYIEDDPVNMMLMEAMLGHLPQLRLLGAADPELGLTLARQHRPELILLDIQLPGIDGYEVFKRLRAEPATQRTPVIAVSANAMHGDIERGLNAGFCQYLTKPLEMGKLLDAVRRQLQAADTAAV